MVRSWREGRPLDPLLVGVDPKRTSRLDCNWQVLACKSS